VAATRPLLPTEGHRAQNYIESTDGSQQSATVTSHLYTGTIHLRPHTQSSCRRLSTQQRPRPNVQHATCMVQPKHCPEVCHFPNHCLPLLDAAHPERSCCACGAKEPQGHARVCRGPTLSAVANIIQWGSATGSHTDDNSVRLCITLSPCHTTIP